MDCTQCPHIWSCERDSRVFYCKITGQAVTVTECGICGICPLDDRQEVELDG